MMALFDQEKVFDIYVKSEVKEAVDKAVKKAVKKTEKNTAMKTEKNTAIKLLKTGKFSIDEIRDIFPGFDDDILKIEQEAMQNV